MINDVWYKNVVITCPSIASFMAANGDGIGDLADAVLAFADAG